MTRIQVEVRFLPFLFLPIVASGFYLYSPHLVEPLLYQANLDGLAATTTLIDMPTQKEIVSHLSTPEPLYAIYMTGWVAGNKTFRNSLVELIDDTELNAVIIDIKDYTGELLAEERAPDIKDFVKSLHDKGIYVIGRVSAFQDLKLTKERPDLAVRRSSDGEVWKDKKGISWLDPGSSEVWEYLVEIGETYYELGFDELNFDYIRFPSDGNMQDIAYIFFDEKVQTKPDQMREFYEYIYERLASTTKAHPVLSADLFGMTTTNTDDLNIGQLLENAIPYFDYIMPMVYPSHYPPNFSGYANPADVPYEIIKFSMDRAVSRLEAASSSSLKLRPWLQDFNLGATYDAEMVRNEMQAVYDSGLTSWALWSPSNRYTRQAID